MLLLSVTGLLVSAAGCDSVIYDNYPVENNPDDLVTLVLNVGLVAPTRAAADNDRELMHSLRIILLDAETDGQVEYNAHIDFNTGAESLDYHFIRTKTGKKKIFLIANEESIAQVGGVESYTDDLTALLNKLDTQSMSSEDAEKTLKAVWFTPGNYGGANGAKNWIPLSSSYAFEIKESELTADNRRVEKTFYLVHAATKFEFEFINNRSSAVQIEELSISSIADKMYLMAKFEDAPAEEKKGPASYGDLYWIDWLKKVSDETTDHPKDFPDDPAEDDNEKVNARFDWIKDYVLPEETDHTLQYLISKDESAVSPIEQVAIPVTATAANPYKLPVVYFPESKNPASSVGNQNYYLSIKLSDGSEVKEFPNVPLTNINDSHANLVTLFRNTHVKITCTFSYEAILTLWVGICPWSEESIDIPAFD